MADNNNNDFAHRSWSANKRVRHLHGKKIKLDPAQFMEIIIILIICYNLYAGHRNKHMKNW